MEVTVTYLYFSVKKLAVHKFLLWYSVPWQKTSEGKREKTLRTKIILFKFKYLLSDFEAKLNIGIENRGIWLVQAGKDSNRSVKNLMNFANGNLINEGSFLHFV